MALHTLRGTMNLKTGQMKNSFDVTGQKIEFETMADYLRGTPFEVKNTNTSKKTDEQLVREALMQMNINPEVMETIREIHDRKENPNAPLEPGKAAQDPFAIDPAYATIKACREASQSLQDGEKAEPDGGVLVDEFDPADYNPDAADLMEAAVETFRQRGAVYGKSYFNQGHIMKGLFPNGANCETVEDFQRMGILTIIISKLSRYCNNFATGGHLDSIHDIGVYSFMLEELDRMSEGDRASKPE